MSGSKYRATHGELLLGFSDGERFLAGDFGRKVLDRMRRVGHSVYGNEPVETGGGCLIHAESLKRAYEELLLVSTFGCVRFVYSRYLAKRIDTYQSVIEG